MKIGVLPKGWVRSKLVEIAEIILGQSPPSSTYNENGIGLPFYQGKAEFGDSYPSPQKWCSAPKKIAEKGDVLISVRAPVGPTNICQEKSCIGRGLAAIRGLGGIETNFILYLLRTFENKIAGKGTGTTFNAITGNQLNDFEIPIPPLPEQHRIVTKIEEVFTKLDAGVKALKKVKAQLKRYRQAVLKYAFEGKLTEEWRKNVGALNLTPLLQKDLPKLPEGWMWTRLQDICEIIMGQSPPSSTYNIEKNGLPFYQGKAEFGEIHPTPAKWCSKPIRIAEKNDILISVRAPVGPTNICFETSCIGRGLSAIRYKFDETFKFVFYYLRNVENELSQIGTGSTFSAISKSQIFNLQIPLPPLPEQHQIVSEIERRLSVADKVEKIIEYNLKQAQRLRQSILKKAFEGKLVHQDPTDEPAEKLLERINKEKNVGIQNFEPLLCIKKRRKK